MTFSHGTKLLKGEKNKNQNHSTKSKRKINQMRFLLNSLVNKSKNKFLRNNSPSARRVLAPNVFDVMNTYSVVSNPGIPSDDDDDNDNRRISSSSVNIWSQRCGNECGCLLRIQLQVDPSDSDRIVSAEYHTKALVLEKKVVEKIRKREMKEDGTWQTVTESRYAMMPLLTARKKKYNRCNDIRHSNNNSIKLEARPVITSCNCKTLKQLANAVCSYLPTSQGHHGHLSSIAIGHGMNMQAFKNELQFESNRASAGFRQHVLTMIGASPHTAGKCFDLVENTLIGLVRGYDDDIDKQFDESLERVKYLREMRATTLDASTAILNTDASRSNNDISRDFSVSN